MRTWRKVFSRMLFFLVVFSVSHGIPVAADASYSTSCDAQAADLKDDCTALEALYDATGGPSWTKKTNWKTTKPLNEWQGVWGDSSGVTSLRLNSAGLNGTVSDLSALTSLTELRLNHNYNLSGTIADLGLSSLTNLRDLHLHSTKLSGEIPDLSALTSLVNLNLSATRLLSGTIPDLSKLVKLEKLYLLQNKLSGTIPDLDKLVNLTELSLSLNNLSGAVPDLDKLVNLTRLFLARNSLDGTIPDLSKLEKLTELHLSQNNLSGEIPDLSKLEKLRVLGLYQNNLSGTIPDLDKLTELTSLLLYWNNLSGEIPDLSKLEKLRILRLFENNLSGTIPDLAGLDDMRTIELNLNRLTGGIPSSLSDLTELQDLFLGDNELSGEIPALSKLTKLNRLSLENNELSGEIPELNSLTSLQEIKLQNNRLSGSLPDMDALTTLQYLLAGDNELSGEIPELNALTSLREIKLQNNRLSGSLPDMDALSGLDILWLYNNRLGGTVDGKLPTSGNWLEYVYLHDNLLGSGSDLSPDLSGLPRLRELSLWGNTDPVGTIDFANGVNMRVVDRAALRFFYYANGGSGWTKRTNWLWKYQPLGQWYGVTTNGEGRVTGINLAGNGLKNGISNSIEALSALTTLQLPYNEDLGGTLPERLADISGLSHVDIRCTRVGTPLTHDFIAWVSRLGSGFKSGCGPTSAPLQQEEEPEPEPELAEPEPEVLEEPEPGPEVVQEPEPELAFGGGVDSNWDCGGCAIVPAADTEAARGNTAFNLLLVMVALLAVSRRGRFRSD